MCIILVRTAEVETTSERRPPSQNAWKVWLRASYTVSSSEFLQEIKPKESSRSGKQIQTNRQWKLKEHKPKKNKKNKNKSAKALTSHTEKRQSNQRKEARRPYVLRGKWDTGESNQGGADTQGGRKTRKGSKNLMELVSFPLWGPFSRRKTSGSIVTSTGSSFH